MKSLADGLGAATFFCTLITVVSLMAALITGLGVLQSYAVTGIVVTAVFGSAWQAARYRS